MTTAPELPLQARAALEACARGEMPPNVAAMHLLISANVEVALAAIAARLHCAVSPDAQRLRALAAHLCSAAAMPIGRIAALLGHEPDADPARWATAFDRAVAAQPEASVALYTLGDARLLAAASTEIAQALRAWGALQPDRRVLDLGCGIGRLLPALAEGAALVVGLDVSAGMLGEARRRCSGLTNLALVQSTGRDLGPFGDGAFDLVLAVDTFPYLHLSGLAETMLAECARVLAPGGSLVLLNYSYRGDLEGDRREVARLSAANGLMVLRDGSRDFTLWDGAGFHLRKGEG